MDLTYQATTYQGLHGVWYSLAYLEIIAGRNGDSHVFAVTAATSSSPNVDIRAAMVDTPPTRITHVTFPGPKSRCRCIINFESIFLPIFSPTYTLFLPLQQYTEPLWWSNKSSRNDYREKAKAVAKCQRTSFFFSLPPHLIIFVIRALLPLPRAYTALAVTFNYFFFNSYIGL